MLNASQNIRAFAVQCDDEDLIDSILDDSGEVDLDAAVETAIANPSKVRFVLPGTTVVLTVCEVK
jgi:hypothetical protein